MQQTELTRVSYVGRCVFHITPDGGLVATMGNRSLSVTPDEARGLFDFLLLYARHFEQASSNGHTSTEPLRARGV